MKKKYPKPIHFTLLLLLFGLTRLPAQSVFINEIHYDNISGDANEGIEIAGPAGTDLTGWSLVLYNGSGGTTYNTIALSGVLNNQQGGIGTRFFNATGLQNGSPDGIVLVNPSDVIIQFLSYEGVVTATNGIASGLMSEDIGVEESNSTTLSSESLQLAGTGSVYTDFTWQTPAPSTYNAVNNGQTFGTGTLQTPLINEFVFNHDGTDSNEFIEIFGAGSTDYSTFSILEIEGDGAAAGLIDEVITIGSTDSQGFWTTPFLSNAIENGTVSLLLVENFTGAEGDDLDTDNDGVLDSQPWDTLVDDISVNDGGSGDITYAGTVLSSGYDGISFTVGGASRIPDGADTNNATDWVRNDFSGAGLPLFPGVIADAGEAVNTPALPNKVATEPLADLFINEIDSDTDGLDSAEFIELFDGGVGNTALDGLVVVLYNGSDDQSYGAYDLDGFTTNAEGYFVLGNAGVANVDFETNPNSLQNGPDAVVVYQGDAIDFPNDTPISLDNILDAVVYGTGDPEDAGLLPLLNAGQVQVDENANNVKDTESLARIPNGAGGARNTASFEAVFPTPGVANDVIVTPELVTIAEARAAMLNETVTVRGVLTVAGELGGPAYVQDATGGIAVFDSQVQGNVAFQIGDSVEITAVRDEFRQQAQLENVTNLIDFGTANQPIVPRVITLSQLPDYPGELVTVLNPSFPLPGDLLFGNANFELSDASGTGQLRIDNDVEDLVGKAQPETCASVTGVVGRFETFIQLLPRLKADLPCAEEFVPTGDDLNIPKSETFDVVTWNIEWFGDESNSPAAGDPDSDQIQKDSVKTVILGLDADVIAVQEITDDVLFAQMVSELPGYDYILSDFVSRPNDPGAKQRVGFVYKTSTVTPDTTETKALLTAVHPLYNGGDASALIGYPSEPDRFWASGRMPFLMVADVEIAGITKKIHLVAIHARANSGRDAQNRYDMRKFDVEVLKDTLDAFYSDVNLVLLGDYNDDVDFTVADIPSTLTSYEVYVNDTANYNPVTEILSERGFRSFVSRENVIDHISLSDELFDEFLEGSARAGYEFYDNDYSFTTSDHLPISIRLSFVPEVTFNTAQAVEVVSFKQGKRRNGRPVVWWRSNPAKALGRPLENYYFNFVSLGFGGEIVLRLDEKLYDLEGNDFRIYESTFGRLDIPCYFYPEKAEVFVSEDGEEFTSLGTTCLDGKFDLASAGLDFSRFIKVKDISDPRQFFGNADGFDLDGIWPVNPPSAHNGRLSGDLEDHENFAPNEEGELEVVAFPNPFVDKVKLNLLSEDDNIKKLLFYNAVGRVVFEQEVDSSAGYQTIEVDLADLPSGIYLMKVQGVGKQIEKTFKLIKR
ncbi:T9SS type A sorting domain-containing protein [Fulvivirga sp. M361]|uniref:endonuclease/exonuclease/phosphatase family protein n=1 Tax=Fulvivirga sp. M361 TaxID=2594266 RepID=UPI00117B2FCA|nr:endonuclease/exonuclease/phosphatase family protein [Fulvivirga sp. M361]TRX51757.1 T9SS type A sorting domain-containing protein [Fulvivirga sp. M361]